MLKPFSSLSLSLSLSPSPPRPSFLPLSLSLTLRAQSPARRQESARQRVVTAALIGSTMLSFISSFLTSHTHNPWRLSLSLCMCSGGGKSEGFVNGLCACEVCKCMKSMLFMCTLPYHIWVLLQLLDKIWQCARNRSLALQHVCKHMHVFFYHLPVLFCSFRTMS